MSDLFLKLVGSRSDDGGNVVGMNLEFHPAVGWGVALSLVGMAIAVTWWSYRRWDVELSAGRRTVLMILRIVALMIVAGVLLRPGLGLDIEGLVRQELVLLLDQSASLQLRDPRTDPADRVRAAIAQDRVPVTGGLGQAAPALSMPPPSREDLLRGMLTNRDLALVERLGRSFDLHAMGFAAGLQSLGSPAAPKTNQSKASSRELATDVADALHADGRLTALGTALREVLERERGRPLGGILLFTDGIDNAGTQPRQAAELARESGVPVQVIALGTTDPRDLQVVDIAAPDVAFVRDEVQVAVRLRARGLTGQAMRMRLLLDGVPVDERDIVLGPDGESLVSLKFTPGQTGDFELGAEVPARPDEILAENNRGTRRLRVVDDRIRVLQVEQSPRWEFRYLQALLLRDRRVELKCVLFDGDPAIARADGSPYLEGFPTRREDLFNYDLILFGDVDPRNFTPAQLEVLSDFVARGGGSLIMVAGRRFSPWGYADTPMARMLPVEFDRVVEGTPETSAHDRPIKLALTAAGRESPLLRLAEEPEENLRRWEGLPPVFWVAPVDGAKPAAQVLVAKDNPDGAESATPVVALQRYGSGWTMFVGTDDTWRWRRNEGEQFFVSFWGRVVQRLAIQHLLSGSRRTQLIVDQRSAVPGEKVGVSARLFTSAFEPVAEPSVSARLARQDSTPTGAAGGMEFVLRAVPDQPGLFHGEFVAPAPGRYQLRVGEEMPVAMDFSVEDRLVEAGETAMQEKSLRALAAGTGGMFFREEDLHRLPDEVRAKAQRVRSRRITDLWSSPLCFVVILLVLTAEWVLRKWWQLK